MTTTTRMTKAQLLAKIDQLERDLAAELSAQRPSRRVGQALEQATGNVAQREHAEHHYAQWPIGTPPSNTRTSRYSDRFGRVFEKSIAAGSRVATSRQVS